MLQRNGMQLFHCGAVVPEVIDGCSGWREGKVFERSRGHRVQEFGSAYANADVRIVMISAVLRDKLCDVWKQLRNDIGILGGSDKCGVSPCWYGKRRDRIDQLLLQPKQVGGRLNLDVANGHGFVTHIAVLESCKLPTDWVLFCKYRVDGG